MGGQACVLYGAAEFSRDVDVALLADPANLANLEAALAELEAECVAVPPLSLEYLDRGHAVHFRCRHPEADRLRLDVMSRMRGVDPFPQLWDRRTTLTLEDGLSIELLSLPDLVRAKKTQRDKDWPMIRRLVEAHHAAHRGAPTAEQVRFWFREGRSVPLLVELATLYPGTQHQEAAQRPLLALACPGKEDELEAALHAEEERERQADRLYWLPLKTELEQLRHHPPAP
jgi:hypothetical protein